MPQCRQYIFQLVLNISFAIVEIKKCANLQQIRSERDIGIRSSTNTGPAVHVPVVKTGFSVNRELVIFLHTHVHRYTHSVSNHSNN